MKTVTISIEDAEEWLSKVDWTHKATCIDLPEACDCGATARGDRLFAAISAAKAAQGAMEAGECYFRIDLQTVCGQPKEATRHRYGRVPGEACCHEPKLDCHPFEPLAQPAQPLKASEERCVFPEPTDAQRAARISKAARKFGRKK